MSNGHGSVESQVCGWPTALSEHGKILPPHSCCPILPPSTSLHTTAGYSCVTPGTYTALYHGAPMLPITFCEPTYCYVEINF